MADSAKLTALGEMAAGVAHEVNNPLAIIKGKSDLLIRKASERTLDLDSVIKELQAIESMADRIAKIVKALKTYSRDAGNDPIEGTNLLEIVNDTLELCRERFNKVNIEIRVHCDSSLKVGCRHAQISQVLMNLLNNSFDAISEMKNKWIEIKGLKEGSFIQIQITDSGTGIPESIANKMMNPFSPPRMLVKAQVLVLASPLGSYTHTEER